MLKVQKALLLFGVVISVTGYAKSKDHLSVEMSTQNFFSSETEFFRSDQVNHEQPIVNLGVDIGGQSREFMAGLKLNDIYSFSEESHYLNPKEVFVGYRWGSDTNVVLGRKRYTWSYDDEYWKRGVFQPRFLYDPLRSEQQGLIGLFLESQNTNHGFQYLVFASPVYAPEFGASYELKDGAFSSRSPWFRPPRSELIAEGDFVENIETIEYRLNKPEAGEVAFNGSAGLKLGFFDRESRFFVNSSFAYKPMNQIVLGIQQVQVLPKEGEVPALVRVVPRLLYHQLYNLEVGVRESKGWNGYFSVTHERPEERLILEQEKTLENGTRQGVGEATLLSGSVGYNISGQGTHATRVHLGVMNLWGGDRKDQGEIEGEDSLFSRRYWFQQAVRLGILNPFRRVLGKSIKSSFEATYDFKQRGAVFTSEIFVQMSRKVSVGGRLDLIGLVDSNEPEVQDGFIGNFRANDRFQVGVNYVF